MTESIHLEVSLHNLDLDNNPDFLSAVLDAPVDRTFLYSISTVTPIVKMTLSYNHYRRDGSLTSNKLRRFFFLVSVLFTFFRVVFRLR